MSLRKLTRDRELILKNENLKNHLEKELDKITHLMDSLSTFPDEKKIELVQKKWQTTQRSIKNQLKQQVKLMKSMEESLKQHQEWTQTMLEPMAVQGYLSVIYDTHVTKTDEDNDLE